VVYNVKPHAVKNYNISKIIQQGQSYYTHCWLKAIWFIK